MRNGQTPDRTSEIPAFAWLNTKRFALFLGSAIAATFPGVLLGFKALSYSDTAQFAYPVAFYYRDSFWRGEFPFWDPLNSCGIPFMAQWNTMTLYPLSLIYLLLPIPWSWGIFCLGHLLLAGTGMYLLAWRWTGNRPAAALAGAAFAFNGLSCYGLMWPHIIAALGWMPWLFLAMEQAWQQGGRWLILAALATAMQLLTGGAEVILQTWLILAVLWLTHLFCQYRSKSGKPISTPSPPHTCGGEGRGEEALNLKQKLTEDISDAEGLPNTSVPFWLCFIRTAIPILLAAGLAMAQLLPFLQLLSNSPRTSGFAGSDYGKIAALPLSGWANYLVPLFNCSPLFNGIYAQVGQSWTGSYYLGISIILLATLAVWRVKNARVRVLAGLVMFGLLMALGPAGYLHTVVVRLIPVLGFARFSIKFVIIPTFALPLLAAFGLAWLLSLPSEKWPSQWKFINGLALGLLAVIGAIVWFDNFHPSVNSSDDPVFVNAFVRCLFLFAAVACLPFLRNIANIKSHRIAQIALVSLAWLDILTHAPDLCPTVSAATWEPNTVRQAFHWDAQLQPGVSRAMRGKETFWKLLTGGYADPDKDLQARRLGLLMNLNMLDQIPKFDGLFSLDLKEYLDVFKHAYFTTNEAPGLLDFLSISEIGSPSNIVGWTPRPSWHPLITAGQQPVFLDSTNTLDAIFADNFNPSQTVYLPLEAKDSVHASLSPTAQIQSSQFTARRVDFTVSSDSPAMITIAQSFYPAWHAYVDNQPTRLWRANYAFQALEAPAGRHQVSLIYEDHLFYAGSVISAATLLLCAGLFFRLRPVLHP